jgi:hypothetical protein
LNWQIYASKIGGDLGEYIILAQRSVIENEMAVELSRIISGKGV